MATHRIIAARRMRGRSSSGSWQLWHMWAVCARRVCADHLATLNQGGHGEPVEQLARATGRVGPADRSTRAIHATSVTVRRDEVAGAGVGVAPCADRKRRKRSALATTETLENAIAAPAISGLSRPAAASGKAATL